MSTTIAPSDNSTSTILTVRDTDPPIAPTEAGLTFRAGIPYGSRTMADGSVRQLKLDIFTHAIDEGPKPLVVYVSGGGFMVSIKESARLQRTYVAEAGFVVASIDYTALTHGEGATFNDGVADVRSAIRFLRANAAEFGIDPARIAVWGESAGGYFAAMAGATSGTHEFDAGDNPTVSSDVQAVVDNFGASSLAHVAEDFDEAAKAFWTGSDSPLAKYVFGPAGGVLDPANETLIKANPVTYVNAATPPFLLFHGDVDNLVSPSQTLRLHKALRGAGASSERYVLAGGGHGDLTFIGDPEGGRAWLTTKVVDIIVDFLRTNLAA
jgi:acetyl esterase/lipase